MNDRKLVRGEVRCDVIVPEHWDDGVDILGATGRIQCPYGNVGDMLTVGHTSVRISSVGLNRKPNEAWEWVVQFTAVHV